MRVAITTVAIACLLALNGCDKGGAKPSEGLPAAAPSGAKPTAGPVEVPPEGKKFEPPITPAQVPAGAWYCDMGTVHWAQTLEGTKTCPLCKMDLSQKPAK